MGVMSQDPPPRARSTRLDTWIRSLCSSSPCVVLDSLYTRETRYVTRPRSSVLSALLPPRTVRPQRNTILPYPLTRHHFQISVNVALLHREYYRRCRCDAKRANDVRQDVVRGAARHDVAVVYGQRFMRFA